MQATVIAMATVCLLKKICLGGRGGGVQLDSSFSDYIREEGRIQLPQQIPNQVHKKEEEDDNDMILQSRSLVLLPIPRQKKKWAIKMAKPRKESPI